MNKTCIIYGSSTGTCQELAARIGEKLGLDFSDIIDVAKLNAEQISNYQNLLLGTSTWGAGELQDDWYDGVKVLASADLKDKTVALFGCGDSSDYSDTFCGGMGELNNIVKESGAKVVGQVPTAGYTYDDSEAVIGDMFVGLALDEVNESNKTDARIDAWLNAIKSQL